MEESGLSMVDFDISLDRSKNKVEIEPHLRHFSPVHPKYFFAIFRTFLLASFVIFSVFLV
jgi:hypothetical protein